MIKFIKAFYIRKIIMKKTLFAMLFVSIFCVVSFAQEVPTKPLTGSGTGSGAGSGNEISKPVVPNSDKVVPLRILSKPRASYTDAARENGVEGVVRLRVTFLPSGEIGVVSPVSGLPYGLTEQAVAAARSMKFEPAQKNGVPVGSNKVIEYSFSMYYKENDKNLEYKAEILEMPPAEHPPESNLQSVGGKVIALVALSSSGNAQIIETKTDLPKEFVQKTVEAVGKIKFKPAIHKNGNVVTQTKEIEYEFSKQ
jgi:TonB family protein